MPLIKPLIIQTSINYTIQKFVSLAEVTTGSVANVEITLPDNATFPDRIIEIIKIDSGNVTLSGTTSTALIRVRLNDGAAAARKDADFQLIAIGLK